MAFQTIRLHRAKLLLLAVLANLSLLACFAVGDTKFWHEIQWLDVIGEGGGALMVPPALPGFLYAPSKGRQILRALLRARTIAAREAGREEKVETLLETGRSEGLELAGWHLSPAMISELERAEIPADPRLQTIDQLERLEAVDLRPSKARQLLL